MSVKTDGDFTTASAVSGKTWIAPIPRVNVNYAFTQEFWIFEASFTRTAVGTAHPTEAGYYLCQESDPVPVGLGVVKFTRTYATKPAQHSNYEKFPYLFIGFYGSYGINISTTAVGRDRFAQPGGSLSRLVYDYFRIAPLVDGGDYATVADMVGDVAAPKIQKYYWGTDEARATDWLANVGQFAENTNPTRETYEGWISAGTEIVAEDPNYEEWLGPFWVRRTRYVVAK